MSPISLVVLASSFLSFQPVFLNPTLFHVFTKINHEDSSLMHISLSLQSTNIIISTKYTHYLPHSSQKPEIET